MSDASRSLELQKLTANEMLFLLYAALIAEQHGTFSPPLLQQEFPFSSYVFANQDVEVLLDRLCQHGTMQKLDGDSSTYEVRIDSDMLSRVDRPWSSHLDALATAVLDQIPLEAFAVLDPLRADDPALHQFSSQYLFERAGRWQGIVRLSELYNRVASGDRPLGELAEAVLALWGVQSWEIGDSSQLEASWVNHGFTYRGVEIARITPWHSVKAIVGFVNLARYREERLAEEVRACRDRWLSSLSEAIHLLVPIGDAHETARQWLAALGGFIHIEPRDVKDTYLDQNPGEFFRGLVRKRMDLRLISPYSYAGPVRSPDRFFGRDYEIKLILTNREANYAVYGSRKIGKTSLLRRLAEIIPSSDGSGWKALFVDCEGAQGVPGVCRQISVGMGLPETEDPLHLASLMRGLGERWCLLLDEIDAGVDSEGLERLLRALRALCNSGLLRVVVSGYRLLYAQYKDPTTAAHNLATPLRLGYLDRPATEQLIRRPMEVLGVTYGERAVERVVEFTQGHPSLVQKMCGDLIVRLGALKQATIEIEDVDAVFEGRWDGSREGLSPEKADQLSKSRPSEAFPVFADDLFFGALDPVEKLLVLTSPLETSFSDYTVTQNMQRSCNFVTTDEIEAALRNLEIALVLDRDGNSYKYAYKHLPRILHATHDRRTLIEALRREEMIRRKIPIVDPPQGKPNPTPIF